MIECTSDVTSGECLWINIGIFLSYALLLVALLAAVIFPLIYAAKHMNEAKGSFIGIGILIVILLLGMVFPEADLSEKLVADFKLTSGAISWVHTGIYATYIFMALAVLALFADLTISTVKSK